MSLSLRINGPAGHICTVALDRAATTQALKTAVEARSGIPAASQRLFRGVQELTGASALGDLLSTDRCACEEDLLLVRRRPEQVAWLRQVERLEGVAVFWWLRDAPPGANQDREVILAALAEDPLCLEYAAPELRADRGIVMAAVAQDHRAIEYASPELRGDRDIVLAAVAQDGSALEFASPELRADRGVVLAAAAQLGASIQHASLELRADREVVLAAVKQDFRAAEHASKELYVDPEVLQAVQRGFEADLAKVQKQLADLKEQIAAHPTRCEAPRGT